MSEAIDKGQMVAALATMILAACADGDVSSGELEQLKGIVRKSTTWSDEMDAQIDALLSAAKDRTRPIFEAATNDAARMAALTELAQEVGGKEHREHVLALAVQVADADGLDDDERLGLKALADAFGVDAPV